MNTDGAHSSGPGLSLLVVDQAVKHFSIRRGERVRAVDGVSLEVRQGEVLGLVGESGCGKSTLARTLLRSIPLDSGTITFDGQDIARCKGSRLHWLHRSVQIVFQDPYNAFDPRLRLGVSLDAPLRHHGERDKVRRRSAVVDMLQRVGLDDSVLDRFPRELSGGQLQRVVIARALLLKPTLLICDEPTSALDASIRAQILNLLVDLKEELGLTLVLISHDLRVVRYLCDRVAVMYLGKIVEMAPRDQLFAAPAHPYTRVLMTAAALSDDADATSVLSQLRGEPPSPIDPPPGCAFHPRCPIAQPVCSTVEPLPVEAVTAGDGTTSVVRCHFPGKMPTGS